MRKSEKITVRPQEDDALAQRIMRLAEQGGAFDFWREEDENICDSERSRCSTKEGYHDSDQNYRR
jgi:uncharacterized protein YjhX (UPF0386 family)